MRPRLPLKRLLALLCACVLVAQLLPATALRTYADPGDVYFVDFYQTSNPSGNPDVDRGSRLDSLTEPVTESEQAHNPGAIVYPGPTIDGNLPLFIGWYEADAPDSQPYDFSTPITGDLSLYAHYRLEYLVTFTNGFGENFLTRRVLPDNTVAQPTEEEMALFTAPGGKHFGAWTYNGQVFDFSQKITGDITLSPSLTSTDSYVFFVSSGSQVPFQTVAKGSLAAQPAAPTRQGYVFQHWSTAADDSTGTFDFSTPISTDTTLYAIWIAQQVNYSVVFYQEKPNFSGDPGTDTTNYEFVYQFTRQAQAGSDTATLITLAQVIANSSSANLPQFSSLAFATASNEQVLGNGSTILNIYFKRNVYTFSFTLYDGSASATRNATLTKIDAQAGTYSDSTTKYSFQAKFEQNIAELWPVLPTATITVPGGSRTFQGWRVEGDTTVAVSRVIVVSSSMLADPNKNGTIEMTAVYLTSGSNVNLHYMFENPQATASTPDAVLYNGKYYIQNTEYSQTVFSAGNPFSLKNIQGMLPLTTRAMKKSGSSYVLIGASETGVRDQYLFYNRTRSALSFNALGGVVRNNSGLDYTSIPYGAALASYQPSSPIMSVADGRTWIFEGWYLDADYRQPFDFSTATMDDKNLLLFAKWSASLFSVAVYDGLTNPSLIGSYPRDLNEYIGDPSASLADEGITGGYTVGQDVPGKGTFTGWVVLAGPGLAAPLSFEQPVTGNLSVYASWSPQTYTVTYEPGVGSGAVPIDSNAYQLGTETHVLVPPSGLIPPAGANFIGWEDTQTYKLYYPGEVLVIDHDVTFIAKYDTVEQFSVYVYHLNFPADTLFDPGEFDLYVNPGVEFVLLDYSVFSYPEPAHYHFKGWNTAQDGSGTLYPGGSNLTAGPVGTVVHLYANWEQYHTVSFDTTPHGHLVGGATAVKYVVAEGAALTTAAAPASWIDPVVTADPDFTFVGWSPSFVAGVTASDPVYADTAYTALYAYTPPPVSQTLYTVTFDPGAYGTIEGSGDPKPFTVAAGDSLSATSGYTLPTVVRINSDFTFIGWSPSVNEIDAVNENRRYTALYAYTPSPINQSFYTVYFDPGVYGTVSGSSNAKTFQVAAGDSLNDTSGYVLPTAVPISSDYTFVGWSPVVNPDDAVISNRSYTAQYAYTPPPIAQKFYTVTFDAEAYGTIGGATTLSLQVREGASLNDTSGYVQPSVTPISSDYTFIGWDPSVDPDSAVTENRTYSALYAIVAPPISQSLYAVTFDTGDYGTLLQSSYPALSGNTPTQAHYLVLSGNTLSSLPSFTNPVVQPNTADFTFVGWSPSYNATLPVTSSQTYRAQYAYTPTGISDIYYTVYFDPGTYGTVAGLTSAKAFEVKAGDSLNQSSSYSGYVLPTAVPSSGDFTFVGWSPSVNESDAVNENRLYVAQYAYTGPPPDPSYKYAVYFDPGAYGTIDGLTTAKVFEVAAGDSLNQSNPYSGYALPAAAPNNADLTFVRWSPVLDEDDPVTSVRIYTAQYAYTPDPSSSSTVYHTVRFDAGIGSFSGSTPVVFAVSDGESLNDLGSAFVTPVAVPTDPNSYTFISWSPVLDPASPVYSDRVYVAQYAFLPPPFQGPQLHQMNFSGHDGDDPPGNWEVQTLGYEGYYDGNEHGIEVNWDKANISGFMSYSSLESPVTIWSSGTPKYVAVSKHEVQLEFTALAQQPLKTSRQIIIKPRPLVPQAEHVDLTVGDPVPDPSSYTFAVDYNGLLADGATSLIGDGFTFDTQSFNGNSVPLQTPYQVGDPEGDYPIYAVAGTYGNYEIYESAATPGLRLAGWFHVNALPAENDDPPADDPLNPSKLPPTGDTGAPPLLAGAFLLLAGGACLALRRRWRSTPL